MNLSTLYGKVLDLEALTLQEGLEIYKKAPLEELIYLANEIRKKKVPGNAVTWLIDRNVNITNVCISRCKFCNFHRIPGNNEAYVTTIEEYEEKIKYLFDKGGDQLLLQGGMNPELKLDFYKDLFRTLKKMFPSLKLHALGPAEIVYLSKTEGISYNEVLEQLISSGLDSLPGGGAEILCDRVRTIVSPGKCKSKEWLDVMREAHKLNIPTSATMMFGHAETIEERIEHIIKIREVQEEKPENSYGFVAFIPWPFQDENTVLRTKHGIQSNISATEYIRIIAIGRILLNNITNIQASWLTVGVPTGQMALHSGANDFGSIMIEENVVSSAGANINLLNAEEMQKAIKDAGFIPIRRNQKYELLT